MTAECELFPPVGCGKFEHSAFEGTEFVSSATDLSPGEGSFWAFCDPEVERTWILVASLFRPSLLFDSINCLQKLKGTDDVSRKEARTDALLKVLRERLAEDPIDDEQPSESAEQEDLWTLWVSLDEHEQRWKEWKQVHREARSHSLDDGWNECH